MTEEGFSNLAAEWQKRLRLQDWNVRASLAGARDLSSPDWGGSAKWNVNCKVAEIQVLRPGEEPKDAIVRHDVEQTLVHELLHLHFAGNWPTDEGLEHRLLEQAVDLIACALVTLKREREADQPDRDENARGGLKYSSISPPDGRKQAEATRPPHL